MTNNSGC